MKNIAEMSRYEILDALLDDGYELRSSADAAEISKVLQSSARNGTLVWTKEHILSTNPRIQNLIKLQIFKKDN